MRTLSRDPFARCNVVRQTEKAAGQTCKWCGQPGKLHAKGHYTLYRYGIDPDRIYPRTEWDRELFCSKSCRDSYRS